MLIVQRRQKILDMARELGSVSARELADAVGTSDVTIRRDIRAMAASGQLLRTRGGAMVVPSLAHEPSSHEKALQAGPEKAAIAALAATLVKDGDSIILGPGTTTLALARLLRATRDLTIVTTSLLVGPVLSDAAGVEVILTGGTIRHSIDALVGPAAERAVRQLHASQAFLSGTGFSAVRGLTTANLLVASTDQALTEAAQRVVVLADHTKIGREEMFQTVPAARVAVLITDDLADPVELERLRELGIDVRVASSTHRG